MLRRACQAVLVAVPVGAVVIALLRYPDFQLLEFGLAAIGHVLFLVYAPLLGAIGLVYVLARHPPAAPVAARVQTFVIAIFLFSITGLSAAAYATFLFLRFFSMSAPSLLDAGDLPIRLAWITSIACFPWAHIALIEFDHQPRTVNVDLVVAPLAVGCAVIVSAVVYTRAPVSSQFIMSTFAVTMSVSFVTHVRRIWRSRAGYA